ncbi:hypothetical protein ACFL20_00310 [Spirochaetota bacterium]
MEKLKELQVSRDDLRSEWKEVRQLKLNRKEELLFRGLTLKEIRKDRLYRELKKKQRHHSKVIGHIEKKISRIISKSSEA